jgi:hypothetical protein
MMIDPNLIAKAKHYIPAREGSMHVTTPVSHMILKWIVTEEDGEDHGSRGGTRVECKGVNGGEVVMRMKMKMEMKTNCRKR